MRLHLGNLSRKTTAIVMALLMVFSMFTILTAITTATVHAVAFNTTDAFFIRNGYTGFGWQYLYDDGTNATQTEDASGGDGTQYTNASFVRRSNFAATISGSYLTNQNYMWRIEVGQGSWYRIKNVGTGRYMHVGFYGDYVSSNGDNNAISLVNDTPSHYAGKTGSNGSTAANKEWSYYQWNIVKDGTNDQYQLRHQRWQWGDRPAHAETTGDLNTRNSGARRLYATNNTYTWGTKQWVFEAASVAKSDLTVTGVTVTPSSTEVGGAFSVTATVKNQGEGAIASGVTVPVRATIGSTSATGNLTTGLAVGESKNVVISISPTTVGDNQTVTVTVDPLSAIDESNETNNTNTSATVSVLPLRADLIVTAVSQVSAVLKNQPVQFKATVKNQGTAAIAVGTPITVSFAESGTEVATATYTGGLAIGASADVTTTVGYAKETGGTFNGVATVSTTATDKNMDNNTFNFTWLVTDVFYDVEMISLTSDATADTKMGDTVTFKAIIKNNSDEAVSDIPVNFVINSGTPVTVTYNGTIGVGEEVEVEYAWTATYGTTQTTAEAQLTADFVPGNNSASVSVNVKGADIVVQAPSLVEETLVATIDTATFKATIKNQGSAPANGTFTVTFKAGSTTLGTATYTGEIAAGGTQEVISTPPFAQITEGTINATAEVVYSGLEYNTGNNTTSFSYIATPPPKPDFVITNFTTNRSDNTKITAEDKIHFRAYVQNNGTAPYTGELQVRFTLDGTAHTVTLPSATYAIGATPVMVSSTTPWTADSGTSTFTAIVDPNNTIGEVNETNNTSSTISITVQASSTGGGGPQTGDYNYLTNPIWGAYGSCAFTSGTSIVFSSGWGSLNYNNPPALTGKNYLVMTVKRAAAGTNDFNLQIGNVSKNMNAYIVYGGGTLNPTTETQTFYIDLAANGITAFGQDSFKMTPNTTVTITQFYSTANPPAPSIEYKPDITVRSLAPSSSNIKENDSVTFSAVIENAGNTAASNIQVRFSVAGTPVSTVTYPGPLASGASAIVTSGAWTATPGLALNVVVTVDPSNAIAESDEANNTDSATIAVAEAAGADLQVTSASVVETGSLEVGDKIHYKATIENVGAETASGTFVVTFRDSLSNVLGTASYTGEIPVGGSVDVTTTGDGYEIQTAAIVSATATVVYSGNESDEENNTKEFSYTTVLATPDLTVEFITPSTRTVAKGDTITLKALVKNQGKGATDGSTITVDFNITTAGGPQTVQGTYTGVIPAGGQQEVTAEWTPEELGNVTILATAVYGGEERYSDNNDLEVQDQLELGIQEFKGYVKQRDNTWTSFRQFMDTYTNAGDQSQVTVVRFKGKYDSIEALKSAYAAKGITSFLGNDSWTATGTTSQLLAAYKAMDELNVQIRLWDNTLPARQVTDDSFTYNETGYFSAFDDDDTNEGEVWYTVYFYDNATGKEYVTTVQATKFDYVTPTVGTELVYSEALNARLVKMTVTGSRSGIKTAAYGYGWSGGTIVLPFTFGGYSVSNNNPTYISGTDYNVTSMNQLGFNVSSDPNVFVAYVLADSASKWQGFSVVDNANKSVKVHQALPVAPVNYEVSAVYINYGKKIEVDGKTWSNAGTFIFTTKNAYSLEIKAINATALGLSENDIAAVLAGTKTDVWNSAAAIEGKSMSVKENGKYLIKSVGSNGQAAFTSIEVNNIDKTTPVVDSYTFSVEEGYAYITVKGVDEGTGISVASYKAKPGAWGKATYQPNIFVASSESGKEVNTEAVTVDLAASSSHPNANAYNSVQEFTFKIPVAVNDNLVVSVIDGMGNINWLQLNKAQIIAGIQEAALR